MPENLASARRLERVLASKQILSKEVRIMSRKQSTKNIILHKTLCNIPIENVVGKYIILSSPADSNGLIVVKLKRKVQYKGQVIFGSGGPYVLKSHIPNRQTYPG